MFSVALGPVYKELLLVIIPVSALSLPEPEYGLSPTLAQTILP